MVHRDVKPSNVLLDAQGNAFLADFGIAKWSEGSINLTGSGVIGTPQYMSPEQGQGLKIDGRSDEYSLAVMAYEMIVGRPPFEAETPLAIVLKHVTEPLTPPISDQSARAAVRQRCDQQSAEQRSRRSLSDHGSVCAGPECRDRRRRRSAGHSPLPSAAPTEAVHITKHEPAKAPRRLRPIGIIVALLVLLTIGIGGVLILSANQPPPDRPAATIGLGANVIVQTPTSGATPVSTSRDHGSLHRRCRSLHAAAVRRDVR